MIHLSTAYTGCTNIHSGSIHPHPHPYMMSYDIDWFIVGTIIAIIAVLVSVYYWNQQLNIQEQQASIELAAVAAETKSELLSAQYNLAIFDELKFPVVAEYESIKAQYADSNVNACKQILMKRAVDCVVKAHIIQQHANQIVPLIQQNLAPADTMNKIQSSIKRIDTEIKSIQLESALLQAGWEVYIIQQAADLSINQQLKKQHEQAVAQYKQLVEYNKQNGITTPIPPVPDQPPRVQFGQAPVPQQVQAPSQSTTLPAVTPPAIQSTQSPTSTMNDTTTTAASDGTSTDDSVDAAAKAEQAYKELMSSDEKQNSGSTSSPPKPANASNSSAGKRKSQQKSRKE